MDELVVWRVAAEDEDGGLRGGLVRAPRLWSASEVLQAHARSLERDGEPTAASRAFLGKTAAAAIVDAVYDPDSNRAAVWEDVVGTFGDQPTQIAEGAVRAHWRREIAIEQLHRERWGLPPLWLYPTRIR